jgi:hypothetical protein
MSDEPVRGASRPGCCREAGAASPVRRPTLSLRAFFEKTGTTGKGNLFASSSTPPTRIKSKHEQISGL